MEHRALVLLALLAVPAAAHGQMKGVKVGTVAGHDLYAPQPGDDVFACSHLLGDSTALVIGYLHGLRDGLTIGATMMEVRQTGTYTDETTAVVEESDAPHLRYGAYASELDAICRDYPSADYRGALSAVLLRVRSAMGGRQ